jgi:hypothetical protein
MCISYESYVLHGSRWHVHIWSILHTSEERIAFYSNDYLKLVMIVMSFVYGQF